MGEESEATLNVRRVTRGDFETVVEVLGNPIRRQIIRKLSEGPDYALRLSNELNIHQQLAAKHLKVIRNADLVDMVRQKSDRGADQKLFSLKKFYSLQIDFSPSLYNERLISFNNPDRWILADNYMERLEDQVQDLTEEESGVDKINPLSQVIQDIDEELQSMEKRRARLLYIRNLAMNASGQAMDEMDRGKRQVLHYILDKGQASVETLSRQLQLREETIRNIVGDLEKEDLVKRIGNNVYLVELI
ncbi:MAG: helix-turn-helix domain-containing protein [Candidatus Bathyarchaeota archaeon]